MSNQIENLEPGKHIAVTFQEKFYKIGKYTRDKAYQFNFSTNETRHIERFTFTFEYRNSYDLSHARVIWACPTVRLYMVDEWDAMVLPRSTW